MNGGERERESVCVYVTFVVRGGDLNKENWKECLLCAKLIGVFRHFLISDQRRESTRTFFSDIQKQTVVIDAGTPLTDPLCTMPAIQMKNTNKKKKKMLANLPPLVA